MSRCYIYPRNVSLISKKAKEIKLLLIILKDQNYEQTVSDQRAKRNNKPWEEATNHERKVTNKEQNVKSNEQEVTTNK